MSDHIPDVTKMIGETPRMKAAQMAAMEHMTGDVYRVGCDIERELNAANERVKRLEEALESIREYWNRDNNQRAMVDACWHAIDKASEALEAKEAKPCIKQLKTKSCIYCMKVECECSDFDVSADMGAKG